MTIFIIFLVILLLCIIYFINLFRPKPIPGVKIVDNCSWFLGHVPAFQRNQHRLHEYRCQLAMKAESQGDTCFQECFPFTSSSIDLLTPELIEFVLKTKFDSFEKGPFWHDKFHVFLRDGIFNIDGQQWKQQRKIASHMFTQRLLNEKMIQVFIEHGHRFIDLLHTIPEGEVFDLQQLFFRYTMDCICDIAFGLNLNTLTLSVPEAQEFVDAFDQANHLTTIRFIQTEFAWKLKRLLNVGSEKKLKVCMKIVDDFIYNIIRQRRNDDITTHAERGDLLTLFLVHGDKQLINNEFLHDVVLNFMFAGRDTTATGLSHLFYLVYHLYPNIEQKLINELHKTNSVYLDAVLYELCRLHPPVPFDLKVAMEDIYLPGNIFIPKSTRVTYTPYHYHRLKSVWGQDAEDFHPERWIDKENEEKLKTESQYKFIAFNAGPRLCLGKTMALLEMKTLASMLINEFHFELDESTKKFNNQMRLQTTCAFQYGLPMTVKKRKNK
ncbi:unnamed protein product [Didymodactylos carnosus]|uniref:Cytochrome P450 n=1 Tax=Didymodactylos carnosus TaxID=1234261 RepID=A0A815ZF31_9BILA|nr:unnamed protein product [Didymodactylos carnosus]CAF1581446.1 unnamed protein product [Didymodactylos carnosus]CAF4259243.1 unnamed protein product [Didymodactylos carnosus]CAF4449157.1 unnamed protein product [Didymodactylos carnosus]